MTAPRFSFTVSDEGWKGVIARIKDARTGAAIRVGIPEGVAHPESDLSIAEIGAIHEHGSPAAGIPARPWLRSTFSKRGTEMRAEMRKLAVAVARGTEPAPTALATLGAWAVAAVRATIYANIRPALKPATIAKKGHALALVDSGALIRAIAWFRGAGR